MEVLVLDDFRPKKLEEVFECGCGGQHFYINRDGTIQCRSCRLIKETIEWRYRE